MLTDPSCPRRTSTTVANQARTPTSAKGVNVLQRQATAALRKPTRKTASSLARDLRRRLGTGRRRYQGRAQAHMGGQEHEQSLGAGLKHPEGSTRSTGRRSVHAGLPKNGFRTYDLQGHGNVSARNRKIRLAWRRQPCLAVTRSYWKIRNTARKPSEQT